VYIHCIYLTRANHLRTRISKWGNSLAVRLPKPFAEELGLGEGAEVDISVRGGQLILSAASREYVLEELVEGITGENRHMESDWGRPKGREVW
jgi:antitoxin MazE